jgi:hypothetical protein
VVSSHIPYHEVDFHPHSYGDPAGRLFRWNGQLYRGIGSEWAPFFTQLFQDSVIHRLVGHGLLVETELTSLTLDGYGLVVQHRYLPFTSYPEEWCAAMLKDAALLVVELLTELAHYGLTLKDGHPWNVLFDAGKPVYVDLSSIIPAKGDSEWPGYGSFCQFCLYPLILMTHEQERIARRLLPEYEGVLESDLLTLTRGSALSSSIPAVTRCLAAVLRRVSHCGLRNRGLRPIPSLFWKPARSRESSLVFLEKVRREVESITLPPVETNRSKHQKDAVPSLAPQDAWTAKQRGLHKILTERRPRSVLDIGSNTGWYSKLAALLGSQVVSFDTDPAFLTQLYNDARDKRLSILPLVMDFTDPTPSRGLSSHWAIAAAERFQCDMVFALELVHRVVFKRYLTFEPIVDGLASFSRRWLVVEFVPREDLEVGKLWSSRFSWYTLDNFINALGKRFFGVEIMPSSPEPRVLLLCKK